MADTTRSPLASRKLWMGILGALAPVVVQVVTGAVTWPVAVGLAVAATMTYVASQAHVDAADARRSS